MGLWMLVSPFRWGLHLHRWFHKAHPDAAAGRGARLGSFLYDFSHYFMGNELIWIGDITITKIHDICVCVSHFFLGTLFEQPFWWWTWWGIKGPVAIFGYLQGHFQYLRQILHTNYGAATDFMNLTCVTSRIFRIRYPVMFQMLRKLPMASMCLRNSYWLMLLGFLSQQDFSSRVTTAVGAPWTWERWLSQLHDADSTVVILSDHPFFLLV